MKKPLYLENEIIHLINNIIGYVTLEFGFEGLETADFSERINGTCSVVFRLRCAFPMSEPNGAASAEQLSDGHSWKWLSSPEIAGACSLFPSEQPVSSAILT